MAEHMEKCSDCGDEFEVLLEPKVPSAPGSPFYCSDCFARNYYIEDPAYLSLFVLFLEEKLDLAKKNQVPDMVREGEKFIYHFMLPEKEGKKPKFICTIELKYAGIAGPKPKFVAIFSTNGTEFFDIKLIIDQFIRKRGVEVQAIAISRRRF